MQYKEILHGVNSLTADCFWLGKNGDSTLTVGSADIFYKKATGIEHLKEITVAVWNIDKLTIKVTTIITHCKVYIIVKNNIHVFAREESITVQAIQKMLSYEIVICTDGQRISFSGASKELSDKYIAFMQLMCNVSDKMDSSADRNQTEENRHISTDVGQDLVELQVDNIEDSNVTDKTIVTENVSISMGDLESFVSDIVRRCSDDSQISTVSFAFKGMVRFEQMKNKALSRIKLREPNNETILFIHDNTILGSLKVGTVITDKYVYDIKMNQSLPINQIQHVYANIMSMSFKTYHEKDFEIKCDTINGNSKEMLAKFLTELIQYLNN